jgi:hypothetical protein
MYRVKQLISKHLYAVVASFGVALVVACCGIPLGGGGGALNDPAPNGTIIYSGQFAAPVSGTAAVYSTGSLILRLSGMTVPTQNGLQIFINGSGGKTFVATLRGFTGNQNYALTTATGPFSTVEIDSTSTGTVSSATLIQTP